MRLYIILSFFQNCRFRGGFGKNSERGGKGGIADTRSVLGSEVLRANLYVVSVISV